MFCCRSISDICRCRFISDMCHCHPISDKCRYFPLSFHQRHVPLSFHQRHDCAVVVSSATGAFVRRFISDICHCRFMSAMCRCRSVSDMCPTLSNMVWKYSNIQYYVTRAMVHFNIVSLVHSDTYG